ncbi:uncharacterized protein MELLADRAFT_93289 [Melampsora larici-populina 98AG31]|uniref:Uncharacterized protein n=1 Tax=Melampsora larici-populina (strain 98AG31 / pathotype 3-4-7) TaxID=747676 RepID=F4S4N4_MELLP|nr:uncharacterized protein MELLADRAFT_93289 [Melampsora larici-populina 98AG31]EGG00396.1 hypothetical protein MELLADRAFT_93289 [Melampsora larici-populina 98AG31]
MSSAAVPASSINPPFSASNLPQELFQGGLLAKPPLNTQSNSFSIGTTQSRVTPYVSHSSSNLFNSQLQGSIRASQSGRRTVGQPKGRRKKETDEAIEEEDPEVEISMNFTYLSGIGKSNVNHGLTPRKFKVNLNSSDWFWRLGSDVYAYYKEEADASSFPSKDQLKKLHRLPQEFSPKYCSIAENGVSVSKESMASSLVLARKEKKLHKTKFGLIFNVKKYVALQPESPEPKKLSSKRQMSKRKRVSDESDSNNTSESSPEPEQTSSRSRTQKRKRMNQLSDEGDDEVELTNAITNKDSSDSTEEPNRLIAQDHLIQPDHQNDTHNRVDSVEVDQLEASLPDDAKEEESIEEVDKANHANVSKYPVRNLSSITLRVHDVLVGQLLNNESWWSS